MSSGETDSSASRMRIQGDSNGRLSSRQFFCFAYPCQALGTTIAPNCAAISRVLSVEPLSTTKMRLTQPLDALQRVGKVQFLVMGLNQDIKHVDFRPCGKLALGFSRGLPRLGGHKWAEAQHIHVRAHETIHRLLGRIHDRLVLIETRIEHDRGSALLRKGFDQIVVQRGFAIASRCATGRWSLRGKRPARAARLSALIFTTCIMNGLSMFCSKYSPVASARIDGANGRNDSRRLIF